MRTYLTVPLIVFALGIAYVAYLEMGCAMGGAMTWNGKVCVEELMK